jgi:hypothetical protein
MSDSCVSFHFLHYGSLSLLLRLQPLGDRKAHSNRRSNSDLVIANRILVSQGILDSFGHISVRSAKTPTHFYLSRSIAPGSVTADDILEYDENSTAIDPRGRSSYLERFIHGEIYRVRPDVVAIVHSHSPAVLPFGMSNVPLRAAFPLAGFLAPVFPFLRCAALQGKTAICSLATARGELHWQRRSGAQKSSSCAGTEIQSWGLA